MIRTFEVTLPSGDALKIKGYNRNSVITAARDKGHCDFTVKLLPLTTADYEAENKVSTDGQWMFHKPSKQFVFIAA